MRNKEIQNIRSKYTCNLANTFHFYILFYFIPEIKMLVLLLTIDSKELKKPYMVSKYRIYPIIIAFVIQI